MNSCHIEGCERASKTRGMCNLHYLRWLRHGDPLHGKDIRVRGTGSESRNDGYATLAGVLRHRIIAEKALGKPLPRGAEVHHVNGNPLDNSNGNLVICPDHAYHALLHRRQKALDACGHADWLRCDFCRNWSPPPEIVVRSKSNRSSHRYHRKCANAARLNRQRAARATKEIQP